MVRRELVEAGASEAGRALALLLRKPALPVRGVDVVDAQALGARLGGRSLVVGFTISGGLPGRFALLTSERHAHELAQVLVGALGAPNKDGTLGKRALGALTELGNIGASAFLNGVARALETACVPSVPSLLIDDAPTCVAHAFGAAGDISAARLEGSGLSIDLCLV